MKCVCGYERYYDHQENEWNGDEEFIQLDLFAKIEKYDNYGRRYDSKILIYACPKCNTLKID